MCYARGAKIDIHKKHTKKQKQAYMHEQVDYFRRLMKEVFIKKEFGEEFEFLPSKLRDGPYWYLVLDRLTMIPEEDGGNSVGGVGYQPPEDSSSSEDE